MKAHLEQPAEVQRNELYEAKNEYIQCFMAGIDREHFNLQFDTKYITKNLPIKKLLGLEVRATSKTALKTGKSYGSF